MDIDKLKSILGDHLPGDRFRVAMSALESPAIDRLAGTYLPTGEIAIVVGRQSSTDGGVTIDGVGDSPPFIGMQVEAFFGVQTQEARVLVTARGPTDWTFADSFPQVRYTLLATLTYDPSPTLSFASYDVSDDVKTGLSFDGLLNLGSALASFGFLLGDASQRLHGPITMPNGPPEMAFEGPVNVGASIGFFKQLRVEQTVRGEAVFNSKDNRYNSDAYLEVTTDIPFQANGQQRDLRITARIYDPQRRIVFILDVADAADALMDEVSSLLNGVGLDDVLAKTPVQLSDAIKLTDLVLQVDPTGDQKLSFVTAGVQTARAWTLVQRPGVKDPIAIESIRLLVRLDEPLAPGPVRLGMALIGDISIGGGTLELAAEYPGFSFIGGLKEGTAINLREVAGYFTTADVSGVPDLDITELNFSVEPSTGLYSALVDVDGAWTIPTGVLDLTIEELAFSIVHMDPTASPSIELRGRFKIGAVDISISADQPEQGSGWEFRGRTGQGEIIPIGDLMSDLMGKFDITLPSGLSGVSLENLDIRFNTGSKSFWFTCTGLLSVPGCDLSATIWITLTSGVDATGNTVYTRTVEGQLTVDDSMTFDLKFSADTSSTMVAASWIDQGRPLGFEQIARAFGFHDMPDIPDSLDLGLRGATFVYDAAGQGSDKILIFACDSVNYGDLTFVVETRNGQTSYTFVLSTGATIGLSNLPLVGRELGGGETVGIGNLQAVIGSQSVSAADSSRLNDVLRGAQVTQTDQFSGSVTYAQLPVAGVASGLSLAADLAAGRASTRLSVPVSGPAATPATGTSATGTSPTGTPAAAPAPPGDQTKWIVLQRAFGPVMLNRLGMKYQDGELFVLLDAGLSLGGLVVSLNGLGVGSPLSDFKPTFHLDGLGLEYAEGPVEIGGAFLAVPKDALGGASFQYDGAAVLKAENFTLAAIGSYAQLNGQPSLFIFAELEAALGGPPAFFVTGLAGGFGYNRRLRIPRQDEIFQFPLIQGLADPSALGGGATTPALGGATTPGVGGAKSSPLDVLAVLEGRKAGAGGKLGPAWVTDAIGVDWLAAGVEFTSFELVKTHALVIVEFGRDFQLALIGLSRLRLPPEGPFTYAYIELELEAVVKPAEGFFGLTAVLSPNSFVIDPSCHLTGGFAFYLWFDGPHAEDFVITLGGYHPAFKPPPWYPQEPRLGINWSVSSLVTIKGGAYFALTPSCVMGGGSLEVTFHDGNLRAWLTAHADFLMFWKPFSFTASAGVTIGVAYKMDLGVTTKTLSVEVGASVDFWGPPTGGRARVHLDVVSFTVAFGSDSSSEDAGRSLGWSDFKSLLPADADLCKITVNAGLLRQEQDGSWIVRPADFRFTTESAIPAREVALTSGNRAFATSDHPIDIRPMRRTNVTSRHTVKLHYLDDDVEVDLQADGWDLSGQSRNVPEALWGKPLDRKPPPSANTLPNRLVGLKAGVPTAQSGSSHGPVGLTSEQVQQGALPIAPGTAPAEPRPPREDAGSVKTIADTLLAARPRRDDLYAALRALDADPGMNGDLTELARGVGSIFRAAPLEAAVEAQP